MLTFARDLPNEGSRPDARLIALLSCAVSADAKIFQVVCKVYRARWSYCLCEGFPLAKVRPARHTVDNYAILCHDDQGIIRF